MTPLDDGRTVVRKFQDKDGFWWVVRLSERGIELRLLRRRRWKAKGWDALINMLNRGQPRTLTVVQVLERALRKARREEAEAAD